jgi:hypothetical protein
MNVNIYQSNKNFIKKIKYVYILKEEKLNINVFDRIKKNTLTLSSLKTS